MNQYREIVRTPKSRSKAAALAEGRLEVSETTPEQTHTPAPPTSILRSAHKGLSLSCKRCVCIVDSGLTPGNQNFKIWCEKYQDLTRLPFSYSVARWNPMGSGILLARFAGSAFLWMSIMFHIQFQDSTSAPSVETPPSRGRRSGILAPAFPIDDDELEGDDDPKSITAPTHSFSSIAVETVNSTDDQMLGEEFSRDKVQR